MLGLLAVRVSADRVAAHPDRELHRWLQAYGVVPAGPPPDARPPPDTSHPLLRVDLSQCIACLRCVRVCDDLQGQSVWHVLGRGADERIAWDRGERFADSSCVGCGACVDACPTAALTDAGPGQAVAVDHWTRTTCAYCGVGCELEAGSRAGVVVAARPVTTAPVNRGHLCVKGRYAWSYGSAPDRITQPLVRDGDGAWQPASWEAALTAAADGLRRIRDRHGPDSIGVLGSARATNEENYLTQKFARAVLGTNNVDCCARVCHTPTAAAMGRMLGTGAATNSFDDIEQARLLLVAGANPTENHPVVGARIRQQVRRGIPLIVIDPRRTELAALATVHLALRPGTNIPLLNALANVIITEGLTDAAFVTTRVDGLDAFAATAAAWPPERAAAICGVPAGAIRAAARLYGGTRPAMAFHGLGMTEHLQGTEGVMGLVNLALLTGNLGRAGAGINPLRGQNNVQGAATMGCDPDQLTGGQTLADAGPRFAAAWGAPLPDRQGLNLLQMIDAARAGRIKALYVIGYDIYLTLANAHATRAALERLELVVVQDIFLTETARLAGTVFLPVATNFEKDGTFMNAERRVQRLRTAVRPPAGVRTDQEVLGELAARLGGPRNFAAADAAGVWDEIRQVWPAVAGISYARLEAGGLQWPCPSLDHPGTRVLHGKEFAKAVRARLAPLAYVPTPETIDDDYPLLLTTGRTLYQFNAGTMAARTTVGALRPTDTLDMAPADAAGHGLADGVPVLVVSRHGEARLPVRVDPRLAPGQLFASFHSPDGFINRLTGPVRDRVVDAPEYKVTAVRIEPA
jgi:formate dehydrogenase major subunit